MELGGGGAAKINEEQNSFIQYSVDSKQTTTFKTTLHWGELSLSLQLFIPWFKLPRETHIRRPPFIFNKNLSKSYSGHQLRRKSNISFIIGNFLSYPKEVGKESSNLYAYVLSILIKNAYQDCNNN